MNKIVAVFTESKFYTKEKITNFEPLQKQYVDLEVYTSFQKKENDMNNYNVIIDCGDFNLFYQNLLDKKMGREVKEKEITYLLTPNKRIIVKAPSINRFFAGEFGNSETIYESVKDVLTEYNRVIEFAYTKIPSIKNIKNFNKGLEVGIDISDFIETKVGETKYKLVLEIPENKEINTEYITPEQISIIKDFLSIRGAIIR